MDIPIPITIKERAVVEIKNIILDKKISDNYGLRIGLKGAGCSAIYMLGFDLKTNSDDIYYYDNIMIFIDKKHLMYLFGLQINFEEGEFGKGFTFNASEAVK